MLKTHRLPQSNTCELKRNAISQEKSDGTLSRTKEKMENSTGPYPGLYWGGPRGSDIMNTFYLLGQVKD